MRFVADEGVDFQIVNLLRIHGHDVILKMANLYNRILVTRDKDFGELVFREKMIHSGIILESEKVIKKLVGQIYGGTGVDTQNKLYS